MRRALRRTARVLVAAVALGLARPALASPNSTLSAPTRQPDTVTGPARNAGQTPLSPAQMRWVEIQVELAWLADEVTCTCPLAVHVQNGQILVEGSAASEAARTRALQLARQFGLFPTSRIRIQPNPEDSTTAGAKAPLQEAALNLLNQRMGPRAASLKVGALASGQLYIGGSITSYQEKLSISRLLKQVPGCKAVRNDLQVTVVPVAGRSYQRVTRDGKLAVDASTAAAASTVQPVLTPAPTGSSTKVDVSLPVRKTAEPVPAMLTTAPAGSLLTTPAVRKTDDSTPIAPVNDMPAMPVLRPIDKTITEPPPATPVTESSPTNDKVKLYTPQWSSMETWASQHPTESTPTQAPPSTTGSSVTMPAAPPAPPGPPAPPAAVPEPSTSPYHHGTSTSNTSSLPKQSAPLTTEGSLIPDKLSSGVEGSVTRTIQNPTAAASGAGTPHLEPVPEGATVSTPEGSQQRPLRGLFTHLFPSATPNGKIDTASGTKTKGETTSVIVVAGQKSSDPVKVNHKPYVSDGVVYFDDETASPPTHLLGSAQSELKKRVLAVTAGKARQADVVVGDKITTIKVTVATEAQEKEVREKILQFPELHSPNMCLETTVSPE